MTSKNSEDSEERVLILSSVQLEVLSGLLGTGETYGLALLDSINATRAKYGYKNVMRVGSIYPILAKLEKQKLIQSKMKEQVTFAITKPRRKYYKISPLGEMAVKRSLAYYNQLRNVSEPSLTDEEKTQPA